MEIGNDLGTGTAVDVGVSLEGPGVEIGLQMRCVRQSKVVDLKSEFERRELFALCKHIHTTSVESGSRFGRNFHQNIEGQIFPLDRLAAGFRQDRVGVEPLVVGVVRLFQEDESHHTRVDVGSGDGSFGAFEVGKFQCHIIKIFFGVDHDLKRFRLISSGRERDGVFFFYSGRDFFVGDFQIGSFFPDGSSAVAADETGSGILIGKALFRDDPVVEVVKKDLLFADDPERNGDSCTVDRGEEGELCLVPLPGGALPFGEVVADHLVIGIAECESSRYTVLGRSSADKVVETEAILFAGNKDKAVEIDLSTFPGVAAERTQSIASIFCLGCGAFKDPEGGLRGAAEIVIRHA